MLNLKLNRISLLFTSPSSQNINQLLNTALHKVAQYQISHTLLPLSTDSTVVHTYYQLIVVSAIHLRVPQHRNQTRPTLLIKLSQTRGQKRVSLLLLTPGAQLLPWLNSCMQPLTQKPDLQENYVVFLQFTDCSIQSLPEK